MGEGGGGQRRQQPGERQRQALDPPEVHDVVGLVRRNHHVGRSERRHGERKSGPRCHRVDSRPEAHDEVVDVRRRGRGWHQAAQRLQAERRPVPQPADVARARHDSPAHDT